MYVEIEPKKTLDEQRMLIKEQTIRVAKVNGKNVRIIPSGLSVTNKVFLTKDN